jgi:hypothetical protein
MRARPSSPKEHTILKELIACLSNIGNDKEAGSAAILYEGPVRRSSNLLPSQYLKFPISAFARGRPRGGRYA